MESPKEVTGGTAEQLTLAEAIRAIWEWRRYRNQVFWASVYRWGAVLLLMTIIPYLLPHLIKSLGIAIFIFPLLACFLAIVAAYFASVQYKLYKEVDRKYRSMLGPYDPPDIKSLLFRYSIGRVVSALFIFFGTVMQLLNGMVLAFLLNGVWP